MSYWRKEQSSFGTTSIRRHLSKANQWFTWIPHCSALIFASLSLSKSLHPKKGLGAALLQDGCPLAFTFKPLTPAEQHYANIEHELLTYVFGAEWFLTYVFGHAFTVESDHKPPLTDQHQESGRYTSPSTENAATIPKLWCHHQVLTWQREAGCRCSSHYASFKAPEIPLDITINHVHITPNRKTEFQTLIQDDPLFHSLAELIIAGWPDDINDVHMLYTHTMATETP